MTAAIIRQIKKNMYKKEIFIAALVVTDANANIALLYICDQTDNGHCLAITCS